MRVYLYTLAILLIGGCSNTYVPKTEDGKDQFISNLIAKMTIEEKLGQLNLIVGDLFNSGATVKTTESKKFDDQIRSGTISGIFNIHGASYTAKLQKIATEESRLKIPLIFGADIIHGFKTVFPIPLGETASWDLEAIEKSSKISAAESSAAGINWTFAPMVDISRDARWGRSAEGAGEDPYLGSLVAKARVRGFQGNDLSDSETIAACAKHFAAYGAAEGGRDYNTVDLSERTLSEIYLPPFKAAVEEGVATIMTSFNEINGVPASGDKWLIDDILRKSWGFDGMVVSDWQSISEMIDHGSVKDRTQAGLESMNAGVDMDMMSEIYINELPTLIKKESIKLKTIDKAVKRVLDLKYDLGLFKNPFIYCDTTREKKVVRSKPHLDFAREMARMSIVLLKNKNELLPIPKTLNQLALVGPLAIDKSEHNGTWSYFGESDHVVSIKEGIEKAVSNKTDVIAETGCPFYANCDTFKSVLHKTRNVETVILALGESAVMNGEGASRSDITLPYSQINFAKEYKKAGKKVVALVFCGRPLNLSELDKYTDAILLCWALGSETGNAIADVVFGDYNPSGKLPVSFPRSVGQVPIYYSAKNTGRKYTGNHDEPASTRVYKSRYIDIQNSPLYPFGFGLSYTDFEYSGLKLDKLDLKMNDEGIFASVLVKNTGKVPGSEIVQMYIKDWEGSVTRPIKELKGFQKIFLEVDEEREISFLIDEKTLTFLKKDMTWGAEPGKFSVFIGANSNTVNSADFHLLK